MIYIFLSVCCSVIVSVLLKLARRYSIDIFQAITWNYSIAILLTAVFLKPDFSNIQHAPLYNYALLGFLLPALFVIVGASVRFTGIVRTDTAQRLSLIIPLVAAFLFFNEQITPLKLVGIIIGFAGIIMLLIKPKERYSNRVSGAWIYPVIVFVGFGVIDVMFRQLAIVKEVSFATSLFFIYVIAFVLSLIVLLYQVITKKARFKRLHIFFGWVLGIANFGNILFYLLAHKALAKSPSIVFSAMNLGVIALGTIIGTVIFKEKTTWLNKAGIVLAIIAVIIIAYAQQ